MAGSGAGAKAESFKYIRELLRGEQNQNLADEASKEFKELLKYEAIQITQHNVRKVDAEKEMKDEQQRKEFPNLFDLLLDADKKRVTNSSLALIQMKTLLDKRKAALIQQQAQKQAAEKNTDESQIADTGPIVEVIVISKDPENEKTSEQQNTIQTDQNHSAVQDTTDKQALGSNGVVDNQKLPPFTEEENAQKEISDSPSSALQQLLALENVKAIGDLWERADMEYKDLVSKAEIPPTDTTDSSKNQIEEKKMPTIDYILKLRRTVDGDMDLDADDDFPHAVEDYRRLITAEQYLKLPQYQHMNFLNYTECTVKTKDDILPFILESTGYSLLKFLESTDKSVFNDQYTEESMWNEFSRLQIADQLMILERKARGPDLNRNVVIDKDDFNNMQEELVKKTEEVEELSTRLSRFASNQLTEGNPNIADLSDAHRPTKVGEMFGQLYDDEWSEAFEALKPPQEGEEEEDEVCVDVLLTLQKIVMKAFEYCSKEVESQMKRLEKDIAGAVEINLQEKKDETEAKEPSSESAKDDNKEMQQENEDQAKDQSTIQEGGGDGKGEKQAEEVMKGQVNQRLKHYVEKQAKEMIKGLASFSSQNAADVFVSEQLQTIIQGEKCNEKRVIAYSKKCIELCWYMSVQDPPMILVALADGDKMNTEQYSYHYRKGKVVELCLWPALFLHTGGPLVAKGHALPKEKGK